MGNARKVKFVVAGAALCAATPALASDFSGLAYVIWGLVTVVGLLVLGLVFVLRRIVKTGSVAIDLTSAALLAGAIAPAGITHGYGETIFVWFPGWVMLMFDFGWADLLPGYPISLLLVGALFFGVLRVLRSRSPDAPSEPEG